MTRKAFLDHCHHPSLVEQQRGDVLAQRLRGVTLEQRYGWLPAAETLLTCGAPVGRLAWRALQLSFNLDGPLDGPPEPGAPDVVAETAETFEEALARLLADADAERDAEHRAMYEAAGPELRAAMDAQRDGSEDPLTDEERASWDPVDAHAAAVAERAENGTETVLDRALAGMGDKLVQARENLRAREFSRMMRSAGVREPAVVYRHRAPRARRRVRRVSTAASGASSDGPGEPPAPPPDDDPVAVRLDASARAAGMRSLGGLIAGWLARHGRGNLL